MGEAAVGMAGLSEAGRRVAYVIITLLVAAGPLFYAAYLITKSGAYPDFSVFWTAARVAVEDPARLYDHQFMTERQYWLVPPSDGLRPWVHPPSAVLLFLPFGLLPFWPAFWLWTAVSFGLLFAASRLLVKGWPLALTMMAPAVWMGLAWGQMAPALGAIITAAVVWLRNRPQLGGALLGLVAAIKPPLLLVAPVALASARQWGALVSFFLVGGAMVLTSLVFGLEPWLAWPSAIHGFMDVVREKELNDSIVTPMTYAASLGFGPPQAVTFAMVVAGVALAWWSFTRDELEIRLTGLLCGSLFCSPYAIRYELAVLAPVSAAILFSAGPWRWLAALTLISVPGSLAVIALPLSLVGFRKAQSDGCSRAAHDQSAVSDLL